MFKLLLTAGTAGLLIGIAGNLVIEAAPADAAGIPIEEIGAQYQAETAAVNVACSQTPERTICYGLDDAFESDGCGEWTPV